MRHPLCKTCCDYRPQEDGTVICYYSGKAIAPDGSPMFDGGKCYERKGKPKRSPQEISAIRAAAGRKGGRKAGYGKGRAPTKTATIRQHDYLVFCKYAGNRSLAETFHMIAKSIVAKHPEMKPHGWID